MNAGDPHPSGSFRRRLIGFFGLPFISFLIPLALLPIVARVGGTDGWVAVGIGQSVGGFAAIVAAYGWTLVGPSRVARMAPDRRLALYGDSLVSRGLSLALCAPVAAVVAAVLAPSTAAGVAALMALAFSLDALSPAWYCIGVGRPGLIARYDVLPRMIGLGAAVVALLLGAPLWTYPVLQAVGVLTGATLFSFRIGRIHERDGVQLRRVLGEMWRDRHAALTLITAGAYSTTPVGIVGAVTSPKTAAEFISADRLYRVALLAVQALGNAFQGWVAEDHPRRFTSRMRSAVLAHAALGIFGLVTIPTLGPAVTALVFGPELGATPLTLLFFGIAFLAVSMNTSLGRHVLIPLGWDRAVLASTIAGAATGVVGVLALAAVFGGPGGAAGLAVGEVTVVLVQAGILLWLRARGRLSATDHSTGA